MVFWFGFAYGLCMGLLFWCREMFAKEYKNAVQQPAAA